MKKEPSASFRRFACDFPAAPRCSGWPTAGTAAAPPALHFEFADRGSALYHDFHVGDSARDYTLVFFYGGSSCPSWKYVMPDYVRGLGLDARVFALNKRFVADCSTGLFDCGRYFHLANHPAQWAADYSAFIDTKTCYGQPRRW